MAEYTDGEKNTARNNLNIGQLFEDTLIGVTEKVAGITLWRCKAKLDESCSCCLMSVSGSIAFNVGVFASQEFFERLALNMRHGTAAALPDDMYVCEYLNIFGGRAVSEICRETGHLARLTVPVYQRNVSMQKNGHWPLMHTYTDGGGAVVTLCISQKIVEY